MTPEWINFVPRGDERGVLVAIESGRDVPFEIKRIYTLHGLQPGAVRGGHAHKTLRQVIICLSGSCLIDLDDGESAQTVSLDNPARGLALAPMVWHEMRGFSPGCVLMVLAAAHYDEADYIRDRGEFLKRAKAVSA
jgi:dTDP-4-dehydrorhamnose 3,5-epimerase-like enzyme